MSWGAVATVGAAVVGGAISADASRSAANTQADASSQAAQATLQAQREANDLQKYMYDTTRSDNLPFLQTGQAGNSELARLLGLSGDQSSAGYGSLRNTFSAADLAADPIYQSTYQNALNTGVQGINRAAAANNSLNSGATLKALARFGADTANTYGQGAYDRFNNNQSQTYNRLAGISGAGQTASGTLGNAASSYANAGSNTAANTGNALSNIYTGAGNSRAASAISGANGIQSGLNSISNYYQTQNLLSRLSNRGSAGTAGAYTTFMPENAVNLQGAFEQG